MLRPILDEIFSLLSDGEHYKIHTLAAQLKTVELLNQLDEDPHQDLFKRNFILMNCLFTLQSELLEDGLFLHINSMDIYLTETNQTPIIVSPLKDYYLNWQNYQIENKEIEALLSTFWQRLSNNAGLATKELSPLSLARICERWDITPPLDEKVIRRQWRHFALKYHPDRGAKNDDIFKQIQTEYQQLLCHIASSGKI